MQTDHKYHHSLHRLCGIINCKEYRAVHEALTNIPFKGLKCRYTFHHHLITIFPWLHNWTNFICTVVSQFRIFYHPFNFLKFFFITPFHIFLPLQEVGNSTYKWDALYVSYFQTSMIFLLAHYTWFLLHPVFLSTHLYSVIHEH